jgi:hypothetical protein
MLLHRTYFAYDGPRYRRCRKRRKPTIFKVDGLWHQLEWDEGSWWLTLLDPQLKG